MKRVYFSTLSFILVFAMLFGCAGVPAAVTTPQTTAAPTAGPAAEPAAEPAAPDADALPAVGDTFSGFTVTELVPMDALGATGVVYTHEKSGATLLYLKSEDTNRSFDITFRTPALDNKGKPHVFEHITICGSQKYPDANMFFPVSNKTYNTYMNAYTYHGMTSYPASSLSESQLKSIMDYYLSGVFNPLLYTEPKLVEREAWRYELTGADADLNIAGTVYSEMQGALTLSALAAFNNLKTLYEGSTTAYESGGIPEDVRTLTYDELISFHDTYYHPSNALITLYGDLDIESFLAYIDAEYLSKFDKKDIDVDMGEVAPYTETKYAEYEVPVEKGAATENASEIYYGFALNDAEFSDTLAMNILFSVILQESSPLMQLIREKLPDAEITGSANFDSPSAPFIAFVAKGVDAADRDTFVSAVDEGLDKLAADGISADALDSVLAACKLSLLTAQEDRILGVDASLAISLGWTYFNTVSYYPVYEAALEGMDLAKANTLVKQYLTDNLHRAVSVTKPAAGLTEANAAALQAELSEKKAAMSAEEISALVTKSGEFIEWANKPTPDELIDKVANLEVADLPEELRLYDVTDETADGVRYLSAEADVPGVLTGELLLDGSTIPVDQLLDTQLCVYLMGELDTAKHDKETLSTLTMRYLPGFSRGLVGAPGYGGTGYYAASFEWNGLAEDAEAATALLSEILTETDYSDTEAVRSLLTRWSTSAVDYVNNNPLSLQIARCSGMFNEYSAYQTYVNDYDLYTHMQELIKLSKTDPAALTARLENARAFLLNRNAAVVKLAGSADAIAACRAGVEKMLGGMENTEREKVDYSALLIPKRNEGMVVNSTVQMNLLLSDYDAFSGKDAVREMLIDDAYMLPQLRSALGAYGAYANLDRVCCALYTYRDPNLEGSYAIFDALPEYLRTAELSQTLVDAYIIGSYSGLSAPLGLLSGAMRAMEDKLTGCSDDMRLKWMQEAKATTVDDVVSSAETWAKLCENGVRSTSATESTLLAQGDFFDVLIYPDGTVKELAEELEPAA